MAKPVLWGRKRIASRRRILGSITLGLHAVAASRAARAPAAPRSLPYGSHMAVAALAVLALQCLRPAA